MSNSPEDDPLIGTTLAGRYRIVRRVGAGGMGAVYLAEQGALRQEVALKILSRDKVGSPQAVERFQKEALTVAGLKHPNIVDVYDFEITENGDFVMVMELLRGLDLRDALRETGPRFAWQRTIPIIEDICRALAAAHEQGVIHRDLKPENIFLVEGGRPDFAKVLDFGVAKATRADRQLTQTGMLVGTPSYIAPEQIKGRPVAGSDLYSIGIMWFEMITGRKPFVGEGVDLLWMHVDDEAPTISEVAPELQVPVLVEELVLQLLDKNARKRPASADQLREHLQALNDGSLSGFARQLPTPKRRLADPGMTYDDEVGIGRDATVASEEIFTELSAGSDEAWQPTEVSRPQSAAKSKPRPNVTDEQPIVVVTTGDIDSDAASNAGGNFGGSKSARFASEPALSPGETHVEGMRSSRSSEVGNPNHIGPSVDDEEPTVAPGVNPNHVGPILDERLPTQAQSGAGTASSRVPHSEDVSSIASASSSLLSALGPDVPASQTGSFAGDNDAPTRTIGLMSASLGSASPSAGPEVESASSALQTAPSMPDPMVEVSSSASFRAEPQYETGESTGHRADAGLPPRQAVPTPSIATGPPRRTGSLLGPVLLAATAGLLVVAAMGGGLWWFTQNKTQAKTPIVAGEPDAIPNKPVEPTGTGGRTVAELSGRPAGPDEQDPDPTPESVASDPEAATEVVNATATTSRRSDRRRRRRRTESTTSPSPEPAKTAEPDPTPTRPVATRIAVAVASRPSAVVYVDGVKAKKKTPLVGTSALKLKAGVHRLRFVDDAGKSFRYRIRVKGKDSQNRVLVTLGGNATARGQVSILP